MKAELGHASLIDSAVTSRLTSVSPVAIRLGMLARSGRRYVRHLGQAVGAQVVVVLLEVDDAIEELRLVDEARIAEQRYARRLVGRARVIVLDVELPGDAPFLEPVEDGGRGMGAVRRVGRPAHPDQVTADARCSRSGKEPIEEDVLVREVPVEGQVAVVVVAHDGSLHHLALGGRGPHEAVHPPPGVLEPFGAAIVTEVGARAGRRGGTAGRRDGRVGPRACRSPSGFRSRPDRCRSSCRTSGSPA